MSTTPTTPTEKASNKNIWKKSISKVEEQEWQLQLQKILFKAHIAKVINENNNKISGETLLSLLELR